MNEIKLKAVPVDDDNGCYGCVFEEITACNKLPRQFLCGLLDRGDETSIIWVIDNENN